MPFGILLGLALAALGHAVWNALARRINQRDEYFTLITALGVVIYSPWAVYLALHHSIPTRAWAWWAASVGFEVAYMVVLAQAYRVGEFSVVYPLARGTSPLWAAVLAIPLYGYHLTPIGVAGILSVVAGVFLVNRAPRGNVRMPSSRPIPPAVLWALLSGVCTAAYMLADSKGARLMSPVLFIYLVYGGLSLAKAIVDIGRKRCDYGGVLRRHTFSVVVGGMLAFAVNAVVVSALRLVPVGYVAATRELSIAFGAVIGAIWLREPMTRYRIAAISLIVLGVVLIGLA
ncbi:MAG: EamA family transporter [Thermaerobacter sp.]|nr:EamA family transporter [Thermaerobacter sp.]